MRAQGTVVKWVEDKDFGFITPSDGSPDLFVHLEFFVHQDRRPQIGDTLSFNVATNAEGKRRAERVLFADERDPRRWDRLLDTLYSLVAVAFLGGVGALVSTKKLAPAFLFLYIGISLLTFLLYWRDKVKANRDEWRIAEQTLHGFSLLGGWPGALMAQRLLHHKSRKRSFQVVFIATVILNLALVSWYTLAGVDFLNSDRLTHRLTHLVRNLRSPAASTTPQTSAKHPQTAVYSWINKEGKRVYSNVGFPTNEPYRDGRIEWH